MYGLPASTCQVEHQTGPSVDLHCCLDHLRSLAVNQVVDALVLPIQQQANGRRSTRRLQHNFLR